MLLRKTENFIKEQHLAEDGDGILIGLSGGADSVCLLRVLCMLREKMHLKLLAVHVNHGIRGEAAVKDAVFCSELCKQYDVDFRLITADIPTLAAQKGCSVEEAGRDFRYEIFERIRAEEGLDRIAAAHHADDNAETILQNLCRGTGLSGLCGMKPVSGRIIRPLLCLRRSEIETFLSEVGQDFRTDESNQDLTYSRNRIRSRILPECERVNAQAAAHINETALILRKTEDYIVRQVSEAKAACMTFDEGTSAPDPADAAHCVMIDLAVFLRFDSYIRERVLLDAMEAVCGRRKDLGQVHVRLLEELTVLQSGRGIDLPYGMRAQRIYDTLRICTLPERCRRQSQADQTDDVQHPAWDGAAVQEAPVFETDPAVLVSGWRTCVRCGESGLSLYMEVMDAPACGSADLTQENPCTKYVDCDRIKRLLAVRRCRSCDRIVIDDAGHGKSFRRYLKDEKVPLPDRDSFYAVADGDELVWIIGGRIGYPYRLTDETRRILKLTVRRHEGS